MLPSISILPLLFPSVILSISNSVNAGPNPGEYEVIADDSLASAMMMGLVNQDSVIILDKVENNRARLDGSDKPVWGSILTLTDNTVRGIDVQTNTFCAAGGALGNGSYAIFGGNQAVGYGGRSEGLDQTNNANPYSDYDGRTAIRLMEPQSDSSQLAWADDGTSKMQSARWYPGAETLPDGSIMLIGGATDGGYINRNTESNAISGGSNPTYETFPATGPPQQSSFMVNTSGLNMYPHMFLMPSGKIFMQANYSTTLWDYQQNTEEGLPDIPDQIVRVYPASGATAMLPLTPANNYTPTIIFCGGTYLSEADWGGYGGPGKNILDVAASDDCSSIQPENADGSIKTDAAYAREEKMSTGRSMGNFIHLPSGQMVIVNGAAKGTAGYTNATFNTLQDGTTTEGLAQDPTYQPILYDPSKPVGQRLTSEGFGSSPIARLYHSSALLLPDGSVLVGGSNPHQDVALEMPLGTTPQAFNTTYELEKWYPSYFFEKRPQPQGMPDRISYGGDAFNVTMDATYMGESANFKAKNTKFMVIRPGFSTHAHNMGQRSLQLENSYVVHDSDGTVDFIVNPMPTNVNLFAPGPALLFCVIDGVPSPGKFLQIGDLKGQMPGSPTVGATPSPLPAPVDSQKFTSTSSSFKDDSTSFIKRIGLGKLIGIIAGGVVLVLLLLLGICLWRRKPSRKAGDHSSPDGGQLNRASLLGAGMAGMTGWARGDGSGKYDRVDTPAWSVHNLGSSYGMGNLRGSPALHSQEQEFQSNHPSDLGRSPLNGRQPPSHQGAPSPGWNEHQAEGDAGQYYAGGRGAGDMYYEEGGS